MKRFFIQLYMNIFHAIILGIVEGLTEFLPISSTGHLIITQHILGIQEINPFFDIVIQMGAISAAVWFYRKRLGEISRASYSALKTGKGWTSYTHEEKYGAWILASLVPTLVIGFIFRKQVDIMQNSIEIVIISTILFGIIFYIIERLMSKVTRIGDDKITLSNLLIMGLAQSISIIPGVSRSGSTIVGGLTQKISMAKAVEISFIMGVPIIFIASGYKLFSNLEGITTEMLLMTTIGTVTSFFVSIWSIKFTIGVLTKYGFKPFMWYRIVLGGTLLGLYLANII